MKIEVCCGSYRDALEAFKGGAFRVELCSALFFGGLTPSLGTLQLIKENTSLETAVMVRPREGGFCYSQEEFDLILKDGDNFIKNGADALVFGFLNPDNTIDFEKTQQMLNMINGRCQSVFHKAFDVSTTPIFEATKKLSNLGISRILTSGRAKTALLGAENIKNMIKIGGIEIMPGGSVRHFNLQELYEKTGCTSVHTSAFEDNFDLTGSNNEVFFTGTDVPKQGQFSLANSQIIANIVKIGSELI